jgi:hypothetical protein
MYVLQSFMYSNVLPRTSAVCLICNNDYLHYSQSHDSMSFTGTAHLVLLSLVALIFYLNSISFRGTVCLHSLVALVFQLQYTYRSKN